MIETGEERKSIGGGCDGGLGIFKLLTQAISKRFLPFLRRTRETLVSFIWLDGWFICRDMVGGPKVYDMVGFVILAAVGVLVVLRAEGAWEFLNSIIYFAECPADVRVALLAAFWGLLFEISLFQIVRRAPRGFPTLVLVLLNRQRFLLLLRLFDSRYCMCRSDSFFLT